MLESVLQAGQVGDVRTLEAALEAEGPRTLAQQDLENLLVAKFPLLAENVRAASANIFKNTLSGRNPEFMNQLLALRSGADPVRTIFGAAKDATTNMELANSLAPERLVSISGPVQLLLSEWLGQRSSKVRALEAGTVPDAIHWPEEANPGERLLEAAALALAAPGAVVMAALVEPFALAHRALHRGPGFDRRVGAEELAETLSHFESSQDVVKAAIGLAVCRKLQEIPADDIMPEAKEKLDELVSQYFRRSSAKTRQTPWTQSSSLIDALGGRTRLAARLMPPVSNRWSTDGTRCPRVHATQRGLSST